jgi:hypothetical protein
MYDAIADATVVGRRKDVDCSFTAAILVGVMHCLLKGFAHHL